MAETTSPSNSFVWQTCLDVEGQGAEHYGDFVHQPLMDLAGDAPGRVLELGCAGGLFGQRLKERYPGSTVVGIEPGRAAAKVAATRIDRVICARLEDVDFAAEGLAPGSIDTIIGADVVEHMVNPWAALVRLRPLLAGGGHLVLSIPNVRNFHLLATALDLGQWRYTERGLLDITHLRFFTLSEIRRMLEETGYRFERNGAIISPVLWEVYKAQRGQPSSTLQLERVTISNISAAELTELCAEQFLVRARLAE